MQSVRAVTAEPGLAKGSWSEIFRNGLGLYSALVIGGIAMNATQMLVITIIIPTIVSGYRRRGVLHLGGDALHDRLDHRRRLDRHGVVAPGCAAIAPDWRTRLGQNARS